MNSTIAASPTTIGSNDTLHAGPAPAGSVIHEILRSNLIVPDDWEAIAAGVQRELATSQDSDFVLSSLVKLKLLTDYQAQHVSQGDLLGLIMGNYRILDEIGRGAMGVVYKAEHLRMRRLVAIKLLTYPTDSESQVYRRFMEEMRVVAQLQHPNIVAAIDDGELPAVLGVRSRFHYFVMEYVPGMDLEQLIRQDGPMPLQKACGIVYQIAGALSHAQKNGLVHRDVKPSNIKVTPDGQAKLLDFGLVRRGELRLTEPGTVLGTIDFMAPEQAQDASEVDIRADIYGLGATLFWCLTGKTPYAEAKSIYSAVLSRATQPTPSVRQWTDRISPEFDAVVGRLIAVKRDDRLPTPQAVMSALLPYLGKIHGNDEFLPPSRPTSDSLGVRFEKDHRRVLVVLDAATERSVFSEPLEAAGISCEAVVGGAAAVSAMQSSDFDLVLIDSLLPNASGTNLCRRLRGKPPTPHLKIAFFSADLVAKQAREAFDAGADDVVTNLDRSEMLVSRIKQALQMKEAQDRNVALNSQLIKSNKQLQETLSASSLDLSRMREVLVLALADLVCSRDVEKESHIFRIQKYCRCLAAAAADEPAFGAEIDEPFIEMLECCAPLHDIGKSALPDFLLAKAGGETVEERLMMQSHTVLGAEALQKVARRNGAVLGFLQMAIDIARSHHERFDGEGYPDRLVGNSIPLAARIVAIADTYDTLRSRLLFKPALSHEATIHLMTVESASHFDPILTRVFKTNAWMFDEIFQKNTPGLS